MGDLQNFGNRLRVETASQVDGGDVYYCSYKLDNDPWIERKNNGSDLLYSYQYKRGFVRARFKNNKVCVYYFNPFADNIERNIQIKNPLNPAVIWNAKVSGNGLHVTLFDL